MNEGGAPSLVVPGRFGRLLAAIGSRIVLWTGLLLEFSAFCATATAVAMRLRSWRRPSRTVFYRTLELVALESAVTTLVAGLLLGFALVTQVLYWLESAGQRQLVGAVVVRVLIRELAPIMVGVIILGRVGTGALIDLGEARPRGWLRQLERQGLDPMALMVAPRLVAYSIGGFCLGVMLLTSTLGTGYLVGWALGLVNVSIWQFGENMLRAMDAFDFIVPPAKCIVIGAAVALVCCATALLRVNRSEPLQRLVQRGFVRGALAILVVNGIFDLVG